MNGSSIQIWAGTSVVSIVTFAKPTYAAWPTAPTQINWDPETVKVTFYPTTDVTDVSTWTYGAEETDHIQKIGTEEAVAFVCVIPTKTLPATASIAATWIGTTDNDEETGRAVVPFSITLRVPRRA